MAGCFDPTWRTGWATRAFFVLADHHGIVVRGLQVDDEDLEELFHRVVGETGVTGEPR